MFRKAIDISRRQNAKSWELRATTSLARLLRHIGRRERRLAKPGVILPPTRRAIRFKAQGFRHSGIISLPGFPRRWRFTTCDEIRRGSRPLIEEKRALGISRFRDLDQAGRLCQQPGRPRHLLQLAGVDQDSSYQRGLPASVYPSVIRPPLHNHIERLQLHLTAIQEQRDFA